MCFMLFFVSDAVFFVFTVTALEERRCWRYNFDFSDTKQQEKYTYARRVGVLAS